MVRRCHLLNLSGVLLLMATAVPGHVRGQVGFGCQKRLNAVCPGWNAAGRREACLECVRENLGKLEPNCTLARAESKCEDPPNPGPSPSALPVGPSPLPPTPPTPGASRPHIVLFVVGALHPRPNTQLPAEILMRNTTHPQFRCIRYRRYGLGRYGLPQSRQCFYTELRQGG